MRSCLHSGFLGYSICSGGRLGSHKAVGRAARGVNARNHAIISVTPQMS